LAGSRYHGLFLENVIFLEQQFSTFRKSSLLESFPFLESFPRYWRAADTLNGSLESFKKSKNKHFVHN
jgi:hypothetical protein